MYFAAILSTIAAWFMGLFLDAISNWEIHGIYKLSDSFSYFDNGDLYSQSSKPKEF